MLGIDFSELGLIVVVALVVLGPKRLPGLVRKIGRWVGKARSMARDFQQQLENEVNLDELNRMTDDIKRQAQGSTPAPEFTGDPRATESSTEPEVDNLAASSYPYGVQEPVPEAVTSEGAPSEAAPSPQPGDDTYSHAHAQGEAPMANEPLMDADTSQKKDSDAA